MSFLSTLQHNSLLISAIVICLILIGFIIKGLILKHHSFLQKTSKWLLILCCIMLITMLCDTWHDKTIPTDYNDAIVMKNMEGTTVNIAQLSQSRPVILYFWGSWCNSCRLLTPSVEWLSHYYPTVGIAMMSGSNEEMRQYLDDHQFNYWTVNDSNNDISREWQVTSPPSILIIYKNKIRFSSTGILSPLGLWARVWLAHK
ncbi:protein disulfide oxidoreductase [Vibrio porteresiae]|uniref:Protein disulfide oxidoreductase n=1 Tax=Vibrio porteresiae DSM 19223 TaxID=1123496 RepID=A0ABZ0QH96_9VIBR|nr:protein disulfide oxidoreductase [Vibrio porteresiae]WPC75082.1 protein disulfide oxidoreductase [Vibrio porteresiae DSM 19223]